MKIKTLKWMIILVMMMSLQVATVTASQKVLFSDDSLGDETITDAYGQEIPILDSVYERKVTITRLNLESDFVETSLGDYYEVQPVMNGENQSIGQLKANVLENAYNYVKFIRYIAHLENDILMTDEWNQDAQAAAFLIHYSKVLTHFPVHYEGVSTDIYNQGNMASGHSNLGFGNLDSLNETTRLYMDDKDERNMDRVGHRRWILNPGMTHIGFGFVNSIEDFGSQGTAMKIKDEGYNRWNGLSGQPEVVTWPSESAFPIELMSVNTPWSISLDTSIYDSSRTSELEVTVTNIKTGESYLCNPQRSKTSNGPYFNVDTVGYGTPFCIVFKPDSILYYSDEDQFNVKVNGLYYKNGTKAELEYAVEFFDMNGFDAIMEDSNLYYAEYLRHEGYFEGTNLGYELERAPTRIEGLIMYLRLLGKEEEALAMTNEPAVFSDVPQWANGYTVYAFQEGLTEGIGNGKFGTDSPLKAKDYATFVLRSKNYNEGVDFNWKTALADLQNLGYISEKMESSIDAKTFTRGDMVAVSYHSLDNKE